MPEIPDIHVELSDEMKEAVNQATRNQMISMMACSGRILERQLDLYRELRIAGMVSRGKCISFLRKTSM